MNNQYNKFPDYKYDFDTQGWGFEDALNAQLELEKAQTSPQASIKEIMVLRINAFYAKFIHFLINGKTFESGAVNAAHAIQADISNCDIKKLQHIYTLGDKLEQLRSISGNTKKEIHAQLDQIDEMADKVISNFRKNNSPSASVTSGQITSAATTDPTTEIETKIANHTKAKETSALLYQILRDDPIESLANTFLHSWSGNEEKEMTSLHVLKTAFGLISPLRDEFHEIVTKARDGMYHTPEEVESARKRALALVTRMESIAVDVKPKIEKLPDENFKNLKESSAKITAETTYNIGDIGNHNGKYYERIVEKPAQIVVGVNDKSKAIPPVYGWKVISKEDAETKIKRLPSPQFLTSQITKTTVIDHIIRNLTTAKRLLKELSKPSQEITSAPPAAPPPKSNNMSLQELEESNDPQYILEVIDALLTSIQKIDTGVKNEDYDLYSDLMVNTVDRNYQPIKLLLNKCKNLIEEQKENKSEDDVQLEASCRKRLNEMENRIRGAQTFEDLM